MKAIQVAIGIMIYKTSDNEFEIFLQKRSEKGPLDGFLEFPGGKIEVGETIQEALVREWQEEVGQITKMEDWKYFSDEIFSYPDRTVHLHTYIHYYDHLQHSNKRRNEERNSWHPLTPENLPSLLERMIAGSRPILKNLMNSIQDL